MKKIIIIALTGFLGLIINPACIKAQATQKAAVVTITGEVITPLTINLADLGQYKQTVVVRKDRDGKDHTYSGVLLETLLQKAGVTMGKQLRGENLTKYVLADASDGYQVIFALAELDSEFTDRKIILADMVDGKPLLPADGPFRIIVQDEKKPARCIKQVTGLSVVFAK
jgi:DMSO/TMAO reductase YedYZ molybdopterin-dependent catalytic subunit